MEAQHRAGEVKEDTRGKRLDMRIERLVLEQRKKKDDGQRKQGLVVGEESERAPLIFKTVSVTMQLSLTFSTQSS